MSRSLVLVATVVVLAACPGKQQQVGQPPSWRTTDVSGAAPTVKAVAPVTFAPSGDAVTRYNEPLAAPPKTPLGDAVTQAVTQAATKLRVPVPVADARLFRACEELASVTPEEGVIGYSLVEFALHRNGIIEPSPHLLIVWADIDSPQLIVEQLQPRLAELLADGDMARVGIGVANRNPDGTGAIVFALQPSGVSTRPIPRSLPKGGAFLLDAVVDAKFKDPEVFITFSDGSTQRQDLKGGHAGGFQATVSCGTRSGKQQVEITASDASGSRVLANFPVWCGATPPTSVVFDPTTDDGPVTTTQDAEQRLLGLVNRDRVAAGLAPLVWDERVANVSRGHSEEMRRTRNVAHISPATGSAADRVKAAQIKTAVVLENVARAYGIGEAHMGLMNSPGHRANIMSASATHAGMGAIFGEEVSGRREIFVTQVFTRVPPKIDPAATADKIVAKLSAVRPVVTSARLASIAQQLARQLAAGKSRDQAYPEVKVQIDKLGTVYARVGSVVTAAADLDSLDGASLLGQGKVDDVGVGVAQGPHPEIGEGAMWIVILLATKR